MRISLDRETIFKQAQAALLSPLNQMRIHVRTQYNQLGLLFEGLEKLTRLINRDAEQHKLRKIYRPIQKLLRQYADDNSFYYQYFSFENHKISYGVFLNKITKIIEQLKTDRGALKVRYHDLSENIKDTASFTSASKDKELLEQCFTRAVETINKQLSEQVIKEFTYLDNLFITDMLCSLRDTKETCLARSSAMSEPTYHAMTFLESSANALQKSKAPSYKYLDRFLAKIYEIKHRQIEKSDTENDKFRYVCQLEKMIKNPSLSIDEKVSELNTTLVDSSFLTTFKEEKHLIPFYEKTSSWSPSVFKKTLPPVEKAKTALPEEVEPVILPTA